MLSLNSELSSSRQTRPLVALIQLIYVALTWSSIGAFALSVLLGGNMRMAMDAVGGFVLTGITALIYWNWLTPSRQRSVAQLHHHALPWCGAACSLGQVLVIHAATRSFHELGIALIGAGLLFWVSMVTIKLLR